MTKSQKEMLHQDKETAHASSSKKMVVPDKGSKKESTEIVKEIFQDVTKSSAAKQIVFGTGAGWVSGYLTMKIGKTVACAVGGSIILLQVAIHKGYIKINWDKVKRHTDAVQDIIEEEVTGRTPTTAEKLEKYVDRKLEKAEKFFRKQGTLSKQRARRWFEFLINNGDRDGYQLQELHIFVASFFAGVGLGVLSG